MKRDSSLLSFLSILVTRLLCKLSSQCSYYVSYALLDPTLHSLSVALALTPPTCRSSSTTFYFYYRRSIFVVALVYSTCSHHPMIKYEERILYTIYERPFSFVL